MALENKLGITESSELARMEEKLSKQRALELFETGALDRLEAGTFAALASIHRALFSDIYDFAGEKRTVNIAKGNFRFCFCHVSGCRFAEYRADATVYL